MTKTRSTGHAACATSGAVSGAAARCQPDDLTCRCAVRRPGVGCGRLCWEQVLRDRTSAPGSCGVLLETYRTAGLRPDVPDAGRPWPPRSSSWARSPASSGSTCPASRWRSAGRAWRRMSLWPRWRCWPGR
jgi:hypothetical protein